MSLIRRRYSILIVVLIAAFLLSACVPGGGPLLRSVHNQTWSARFDVHTEALGSAISFPLNLDVTFQQQLADVQADTSLSYDSFIQLRTGSFVTLQGRIGLNDSLQMSDNAGLFSFDGYFYGDRLIGTVSIAGLIPVTDVTFTRTR